MKETFDKDANAVYIYLEKIKKGGVQETIELTEDILIDLDKKRKILGIEILNSSQHLSKKFLKKAKRIDK